VKFGLNIINFGPGASPAAMKASVQRAENSGFQLAMLSDHVAITPDVARAYPETFYEPFTAIAWLAGLTSTIELGTTVIIVPYRHNLLNARMVANLDQLCAGRFIVGVGVGWAREEFAALGVPFERRGQLTDDYLRSIEQPHPPIWVGGHSPAAIRRAARFGDAWHPLNARLAWLTEHGLPRLREHAERLERPVPSFAPRIKLLLTDRPLPDDERRPGQGTLDQIRRDLAALAALGAEYVVLDTYHGHPDELTDTAAAQHTLDMLVEHVIDAPGQTLRPAH
jgi:alkanesulfonate monooxygenase SsuD/methylene tetrahydromethanopterin reductase-like flavin-dependent oxidoreductase (luciferase family)